MRHNLLYASPLPELKLFKEIIISVFKSKTNIQRTEAKQLSSQLEEAIKRLSKARDLLLAGDIEADDYRTIKSETEEKINRFEAKLAVSVKDTTDIEPLLNTAISNISQLDVLYTKGSVTQKRRIIGSMFPEKLTFDGFEYRTTRVNEAITLMLLISKKLKGKKNGTNHFFSDLSPEVNCTGLEPVTPTLSK
jgi:site-specific DNA recombinase